MSFKANLLSNYLSQIYVAVLGILILPLYIKLMGVEAYGLVGFFSMLQVVFGLLDAGLTPTISRETARYKSKALSDLDYLRIVRALTIIFFFIAIVGGGSIFLLANVISIKWLNSNSLPLDEIIFAVKVMGISVALRWASGLCRGIITGNEKITWLSYFNIFIASIRFVGVLLSMYLFGYTPSVFFIHQMCIAVIEFIGLILLSYNFIPSIKKNNIHVGWSIKAVKPLLKFSLTIAFTSCVWILITQTDKIILSGLLSLKEYGYFSLGVLGASCVMILNAPISNTVMPRLVNLYSSKNEDDFIDFYRMSTQIAVVIAGCFCITVAFFAKRVLFVWTGDYIISKKASFILTYYCLGNGMLILSSFPYYFQYAIGNLKYHFFGNIMMGVTLIPSIIYMAKHYGSSGAAVAWCVINFLFLFFWTWFVHSKLRKGLHLKWITHDILKILILPLIFTYISSFYAINISNRYYEFVYIFSSGLFALILSMLSSDNFRVVVKKKLSRNK